MAAWWARDGDKCAEKNRLMPHPRREHLKQALQSPPSVSRKAASKA